MKAVLVGYDLMYDETGRLVPIEMNTNVGYDPYNRAELEKDWQQPDALLEFIEDNGITKVYLDTKNGIFWHKGSFILEKLVEALGEENVIKYTEGTDVIADADDILIVRVEYSEEAIVDSYCKDKVAFLELIKDSEDLGQDFLYKEDGEVKGDMDFVDNGDHPNYVVKYRYPNYDSTKYPEFYKLASLDEVEDLAESLEDDFLIMKAYFNEYGAWENRFKEIRSWSIITATGENIELGAYTKVTGEIDTEKNVWDEDGKLAGNRQNYLTDRWYYYTGELTYLDATDQVLTADGTWKDASELKKGDEILSLNIPFGEDVDISQHVGDYHITEEELREGSTITINEIKRVDSSQTFIGVVHLMFEEDEEEWWDLAESSYPVEDPEDGSVVFKEIQDFKVGEVVYLLSTAIPDRIEYIKRTVSDVWKERNLVTGYSVSVDGSHLLITRSPESTANYVSIEHNPPGGGDISGPSIDPVANCLDEDACCNASGSYKICFTQAVTGKMPSWNGPSSSPLNDLSYEEIANWAEHACGELDNTFYCTPGYEQLLEYVQTQYHGNLSTGSLKIPDLLEYSNNHPITISLSGAGGPSGLYPWIVYYNNDEAYNQEYQIQRYFVMPACATTCQQTGSLNN